MSSGQGGRGSEDGRGKSSGSSLMKKWRFSRMRRTTPGESSSAAAGAESSVPPTQEPQSTTPHPSPPVPETGEEAVDHMAMEIVPRGPDTREWIQFERDGITFNKTAGHKIRKAFEERQDPGAINWSSVPIEMREFYWKEFKKDYRWHPSQEEQVVAAWKRKAQERYKTFTSRAKDKAKEGKRPTYIDEPIWDEWRRLWQQPEHLIRSDRGSTNRRGGDPAAQALPTHLTGSVNLHETQRRLAAERGTEPNKYEVFLYAQTKNHDGITFVTDHAREVNDEFIRLRDEAVARGEEVDEDKLYYLASGGHDKRQKVFGVGALGNEFERPMRSRCSSSSSFGLSQEEVSSLRDLNERLTADNERLCARLTETQEKVERLESQVVTIEERISAQVRAQMQVSLQEQMEAAMRKMLASNQAVGSSDLQRRRSPSPDHSPDSSTD